MHAQSECLEYACPKCGYFNPAPRALRQARNGGRTSVSPSPPSGRPLALPLGQPVNAGGSNIEPKDSEKVNEHMDVDATSS